MNHWSFKVKVGVYAAFLTMAALVAGALVMLITLHFFQVSELDEIMKGDAEELVWDVKNFRDAPKGPREPLREELIPVDMRDYYLVIEGPENQMLYQSSNLKGNVIHGEIGRARTENIMGAATRIGSWWVDPYLVHVGARVNVIERFQKDVGIGFAAALPVVGLVVFFGGMWLGRRTVEPVAKLSAAAERISASNPHERLPIPTTKDEIATLTEVLNRSFDRLQRSYDAATRFSADASHQLKTPISILRAGLDHLSQETELNASQAAEVATLRHQTRRLTSLIEDLLLLAQADAGRMAVEKQKIDLKALILAAEDDLKILVTNKGISVEVSLADELTVLADRRLMAMVLQNLTENAAKYTDEGGCIRISGSAGSGRVMVTVVNTGKDISIYDRDLVFERFRRGSDAGGEVRGHGLGLNIARELVRAHGGELRLNPSEPGWIEFEFQLPQ